MTKEVYWLGPAPSEEDCVQAGSDDYEARARTECAAYIEAIRRVCGPEPDGARLRVERQPHDFGGYLEVCCEFDGNDEVAAVYAAKCDDDAPKTWADAGMVAPAPPPSSPPGSTPPTSPGTPLALPLPPDLCLTIGYRGDARFVGFFWSPFGDQLVATDGINSGTAQSWAFLAYKRHRAVAPLLAPFDLGSSEEDAVHMLVIDRERNAAGVAPVAEARAFLIAQHPPAPELTPDQQAAFEKELERLLTELRERPIDHGTVAREMEEQRERVAKMMEWLNVRPVPPAQGPEP